MSPATTGYDVAIVGAGHNGLVTAALLAREGLRVVVLEQRTELGGMASTREVFSGYRFEVGADRASLFRPELIDELCLREHGLELVDSDVTIFAPRVDGPSLTLHRDIETSVERVLEISTTDAGALAAFAEQTKTLSSALVDRLSQTPSLGQLGSLLEEPELLRVMSLSAHEVLGEWFESDALRGVFGSLSVAGSLLGPRSAGTGLMLLYQMMGAGDSGLPVNRRPLGGMGRLSGSLAGAAKSHGARIRTGQLVDRILVEDGRARGVRLRRGDTIQADRVVSNVDPLRTLLGLVGGHQLEPRMIRRLRKIRFLGGTAKLNLALEALPEFHGQNDEAQLSGRIVIAPSLEYIERAFDAAKYGHFSPRPCLEISIPSILDTSMAPEGKHVMSVVMQYAPWELRGGGWEPRREALAETIIETLGGYAPGIERLILHQQLMTPLDWHRRYGATEGSIHHGQMGLDQMFVMRPVVGWNGHRTPIENLYLCGAGTHPGGGVTGWPGMQAAREILAEIGSGGE